MLLRGAQKAGWHATLSCHQGMTQWHAFFSHPLEGGGNSAAAFQRTILLPCLLRHRYGPDHDAGMLLAEVPECAR